MAQQPPDLFRTFRFDVTLAGKSLEIGSVDHRPEGLVISRAHEVGQPTLFSHFAEYDPKAQLRVRLIHKLKERHMLFELGDGARHLAVRGNVYDSGFAVDRVLFPNAKLLMLRDAAPIDEDRFEDLRLKVSRLQQEGYKITLSREAVWDVQAFHDVDAVAELEQVIDREVRLQDLLREGKDVAEAMSIMDAEGKVATDP